MCVGASEPAGQGKGGGHPPPIFCLERKQNILLSKALDYYIPLAYLPQIFRRSYDPATTYYGISQWNSEWVIHLRISGNTGCRVFMGGMQNGKD